LIAPIAVLNAMAHAPAWGLARSRPLLDAFAARIAPGVGLTEPVVLDHIPGSPDASWDVPHYFLTLGPPRRPDHAVRTGPRINRSARVWADIDLLLTSSTITEAWERTRARREE
jgi:hypothetical protein